MARLAVLASGSAGNGYVLSAGNETLLLEAGVSFREVQKTLDFDTYSIAGCLVTHEHGDHAAYVSEYIKNAADMYASAGTIDKTGVSGHRVHAVCAEEIIKIGGFKVLPFEVKHDAAEPLGFLIWHKKIGTLLFATDTFYLPNRFSGLNHVLIECNYAEDILKASGQIPDSVKERTRRSHMELGTCKEFLLANDLSGVSNVVLLHISSSNGDRGRFVREIAAATGKPVYAAKAGMAVYVGKDGF